MSLIGDIVERENTSCEPPAPEPHAAATGFPKLKRIDLMKRPSRFKTSTQTHTPGPQFTERSSNTRKSPESEAQKIHKENMKKLSEMTDEEISQERQELLQGLDPKLVQSLLQRTEARAHKDHNHLDADHAEGYGGWIGGGTKGQVLPPLDDEEVNSALGVKSVSFSEDVEAKQYSLDHFTDTEERSDGESEDDDVAPAGYQIAPEEPADQGVHFMRPKQATSDPDLDLNDPKFFDKLHEKYYPDLPREANKMAWMKTPLPEVRLSSYDAISDMRFDFQGNLVELDEKSQDVPMYKGLHHHSDNPQLAGYTLPELLHLSRSVVPTQRCLGIQMLGRILHKLGQHKYNIVPLIEGDANDGSTILIQEQSKQAMDQFEGMMWELIEQLRVVESLTEASDAKHTRNLSVRNYALEALWLWKQGGGNTSKPQRSEEDIIAEQLQQL